MIVDSFFHDIQGLVHIGANGGDERHMYHDLGLNVLWIEADPNVTEILKHNIEGYKNQRAIQGLITDVDDKEYQFHISNNAGLSSSILDLKDHVYVWNYVKYIGSIPLKSVTLSTLFKRENIDPRMYQGMILDTQGSELLVLEGSKDILHNFKYIRTEVCDFESYKDCYQLRDIESFMSKFGYKEIAREITEVHPVLGKYYEVVYENQT